MIINIRGTSGSGKTTVARGIMGKYAERIPLGDAKKPIGYELRPLRGAEPAYDGTDRPNLYVVGSYENVCGGCDSIKTQDEICDRVRTFAAQGDVMFEGLLMSHIFDRYRLLDLELEQALGQKFIFGWLDTPLEVCLDRVRARRDARAAAKGKELPPLNVENTTAKWYSNRMVMNKMVAAGRDVRWIPFENPVSTVWDWMNGAKTHLVTMPVFVPPYKAPPKVKKPEVIVFDKTGVIGGLEKLEVLKQHEPIVPLKKHFGGCPNPYGRGACICDDNPLEDLL